MYATQLVGRIRSTLESKKAYHEIECGYQEVADYFSKMGYKQVTLASLQPAQELIMIESGRNSTDIFRIRLESRTSRFWSFVNVNARAIINRIRKQGISRVYSWPECSASWHVRIYGNDEYWGGHVWEAELLGKQEDIMYPARFVLW
jgi:hypothetical protein